MRLIHSALWQQAFMEVFVHPLSRRRFVQSSTLAAAAIATRGAWSSLAFAEPLDHSQFLSQFDYGEVLLSSDLQMRQMQQTHATLMQLSDDSLLKPFREMAGMPAPGKDLGGWYHYEPDYKGGDYGFAPGANYGQWVSALARFYAITGDDATRDKVLRLNRLYAQTISSDFYSRNRFPAYCFDKVVLGLLDSHTYLRDSQAFAILNRTTDTALPHLPPHAIEHGTPWRPDKHGAIWTWDESYTMPENLFLAYQRGAGRRYYDLAFHYLDDKTWFEPLSRGENVLAGRHAYSYVNSLSSAMMAYIVGGSEMHLRAARNAFRMVVDQSYATGGWGPDEQLRAPGTNDVYNSLQNSHASFETPCGSYAHFKLTRYLLRVSRDSRYGDSMERVMYNTVLGAKSLQDDGKAFYYSDYNYDGKRVFHVSTWPCCSGTLPQVAADYHLLGYFHSDHDLFVNLYIPSTLRWQRPAGAVSLTQTSDWPYDSQIAFTFQAAKPTQMTIHFRIPAWTRGAILSINGTRWQAPLEPGTFAPVQRTWKSGDRVELEIPLTARLEAIDPRHPKTVAVMLGPLVLFALKPAQESPMPTFRPADLTAMQRISEREWRASSGGTTHRFVPFTEVGSEPYSTYVNLL